MGGAPAVRCWKETDLRNWELCKLPRRAPSGHYSEQPRTHVATGTFTGVLTAPGHYFTKGFFKGLGPSIDSHTGNSNKKAPKPCFYYTSGLGRGKKLSRTYT